MRGFASGLPAGAVEVTAAEPVSIGGGFAADRQAGRPVADVVLTDNLGLVLGTMRRLLQPLPAAMRQMGQHDALIRPLAGDLATVISVAPGGPLLLHRREALPTAPRTAKALLDYVRQQPGRFVYARPRESLLGLQFVAALPHLLGDSDPADPEKGWARSWAYLEALGPHIGFYAASTAAAVDELAEGGCDLMPANLTTYLRHRATGHFPTQIGLSLFEDGPLLPLGLFLAMPEGVPEERLAAIGALAAFLTGPAIQGVGFDRSMPPGPILRASWNQCMPPRMAESLAAKPLVPPLAPEAVAHLLRRWDAQIGDQFSRQR